MNGVYKTFCLKCGKELSSTKIEDVIGRVNKDVPNKTDNKYTCAKCAIASLSNTTKPLNVNPTTIYDVLKYITSYFKFKLKRKKPNVKS